MTSNGEHRSLSFVSWNTNGIKNTKRSPKKFSKLMTTLSTLQADIVFIQETHIGPKCNQKLCNIRKVLEETWNVFFTVQSNTSKGVAILIKKDIQFEYICHDEDCSGGYIVLFCHLYGELYTLVNVYNHKEDRIVLGRLKEYLMETAEGVLVVGGDFNTVLNPSIDRKPPSAQHSPLEPILQDFTKSLKIIDTWSQKHSDTETENRFTRKQGESASRLDMFFLHEDQKQRLNEIEVKIESISDHYPLVLELRCHMQFERKLPKIITSLEKFEYNSDKKAGKISGAEILSAIKSLPEEHRQDNWILLTETLKPEYNDMLKSQKVPENFKHEQGSHEFTRDYLIFSEVLAKRLNAFLSIETKYNDCVVTTVISERSEQKISWSFLKSRFEKLKNEKTKQAPFVPPADFSILGSLLPKTQSTSGDLRDLQPGCPLTSAVLYLALDQLNLMVSDEAMKTIICYHKQTLIIHAQQNKQKQIGKIVEEFKKDSNVRLDVQYHQYKL